jgi:hypothetical protein
MPNPLKSRLSTRNLARLTCLPRPSRNSRTLNLSQERRTEFAEPQLRLLTERHVEVGQGCLLNCYLVSLTNFSIKPESLCCDRIMDRPSRALYQRPPTRHPTSSPARSSCLSFSVEPCYFLSLIAHLCVRSVYQEALRTLFDLAKESRITAHLFRHTFATELLTARNSVETVAALLGHSSTKVTSRHYSHWVKGCQEELEEAVKNSWAQLGTVGATA